MSIYICEKCGVQYDLGHGWYEYVVNGEVYHVSTVTAFCHKCQKYEEIQIGLKKVYIEKYIQSLHKKLQASFWLLFNKRKKNEIKSQIKRHENLLDWISENGESYTSCLKCGSSDISIRDIDKEVWCCIGQRKGTIQGRHLCFGGRLKVVSQDDSGIRFRIKATQLYPNTICDFYKTYKSSACGLASQCCWNELAYWVENNKSQDFPKYREPLWIWYDNERALFWLALLSFMEPDTNRLYHEYIKEQCNAFNLDKKYWPCPDSMTIVEYHSYCKKRFNKYRIEIDMLFHSKYGLPIHIVNLLYSPYEISPKFNIDMFESANIYSILINTFNAEFINTSKAEKYYFNYIY